MLSPIFVGKIISPQLIESAASKVPSDFIHKGRTLFLQRATKSDGPTSTVFLGAACAQWFSVWSTGGFEPRWLYFGRFTVWQFGSKFHVSGRIIFRSFQDRRQRHPDHNTQQKHQQSFRVMGHEYQQFQQLPGTQWILRAVTYYGSHLQPATVPTQRPRPRPMLRSLLSSEEAQSSPTKHGGPSPLPLPSDQHQEGFRFYMWMVMIANISNPNMYIDLYRYVDLDIMYLCGSNCGFPTSAWSLIRYRCYVCTEMIPTMNYHNDQQTAAPLNPGGINYQQIAAIAWTN